MDMRRFAKDGGEVGEEEKKTSRTSKFVLRNYKKKISTRICLAEYSPILVA